MATIDSLTLKATPLTTDTIELNDGKKATLASVIALVPASGDVVGPASATSGNLATYDGTTGKLLGEVAPSALPVSTAQADADAVVLASAASDATTKASAAQSAASSDATTKANAAASYAIGVASADATAKVLVETNRATAAETTNANAITAEASARIAADALKANLASPSFTTPSLGVATATSINGVGITGSGGVANSGTTSLNSFTGSGTSSGTNTGNEPAATASTAGTVPGLGGSTTTNAATVAQVNAKADAADFTRSLTLTPGLVPSTLTFSKLSYREWFGFLDEDLACLEIFGANDGERWQSNSAYQCTVAKGSAGSGVIKITPTGSAWVAASYAMSQTPFVGVEITPISTLTVATGERIDFGWNKPGGSQLIFGTWYVTDGTVAVRYSNAAGSTTATSTPVAIAGTPYKLGVAVADRCASVWVKLTATSDWIIMGRIAIPTTVLDMRVPATLAQMRPSIGGAKTTGTGAQTFSSIRVGPLKGVGLANQSLVKYDDGTPMLTPDGRNLVIANKAHVNDGADLGREIACSNGCLFAVDITTGRYQTLGHYSFLRSGVIYGENSGCAVWDSANSKFKLIFASWGSFGVAGEVDMYLYDAYTLPRGEHVFSSGSIITVPTGSVSSSNYDADIQKIGSDWYIAYSRTSVRGGLSGWNFGPVLAKGPSLSSLTLVADASSGIQSEGNTIVTVGGTNYVASSRVSAGEDFRSIVDMSITATIAIPWGNQSVQAHPCIITRPMPDGTTRYYWLGFLDTPTFSDGSYSWGPTTVSISDQSSTGWEHPAKMLPVPTL